VKVLFLDIDGVLNSHSYFKSVDPHLLAHSIPERLCKENITHLNTIVRAVPCVIVISSSWRHIHDRHEMALFLGVRGFGGAMILGQTPIHRSLRTRGAEIQAALDNMPEPVTGFVILDDDNDGMDDFKDNFVRTDSNVGLTSEDAEKAIRILRRETR